MKKIYRPFIKGTNWALAGLLSLFGFSCCNDASVEYGAPYGEYSIKGKVLNEKNEPISGIELAIKPEFYHSPDTTYSDPNGLFNYTEEFGAGGQYKIIATDIDGEKNGSYKQDSINVKFEADDYIEKGKGWYVGKAEKEVTIILKEQENKEDE